MNLLVIGGVAAGTKAAAKYKRLDRAAHVTVLSKSQDISYAGCGLPYYVGGMIESREELIVNTPAKYSDLTGVEVLTGREVTSLDPQARTAVAKNLATGEEETYSYDACVIAVGASPVAPPVPGVNLPGVFTVRTPDDAQNIRAFVDSHQAHRAVVVGGGFIGLEMAENLKDKGLSVTVVDLAPQLLPNIFDPEMALYLRRHLQKQGVQVLTSVMVEGLEGGAAVTGVKTGAGLLPADVVILSAGIRPNTAFLNDIGLDMVKGTILTDDQGRTNLPGIYAAGDCAMVHNRITGKPAWSPMGSTANYIGRTLAQALAGRDAHHPGVLGTGVAKLPGINCARTGLTEAQAVAEGYDVITAVAATDDKAHYYEDASFFITKLIADKTSRRLLGAQIIGPGAVDKMADVAVTAIAMKATLSDLDNLDLSYAPPFSTAIHPFVQAVHVLENKLDGLLQSMTPAEYLAGKARGFRVIDVSPKPSVPGAMYVELGKVVDAIPGVEKDEACLLVCAKGKRSYFLQNRLRAGGYTNVWTLEGGLTMNDVRVPRATAALPAEEIARVKALGCLWDKRSQDIFNVRVITVNGKITSDQHIAVAEAARKFGSGEVTMTTRLTLEIQGVPFDNIEPLREYLAQYGLQTGGTGSKVRPVVSCKGTTCQYGLIDTFALSEKIHELYYVGYHEVKLPHKFKIAVGGCPNNCVKPDLNDLGIVGQRVPVVEGDKCKGCKVCQIEKVCPIHVAQMVDGKIQIDPSACNHCGRCAGKCPFHVTDQYMDGYRVYLGGRWGKNVAHGKPLSRIFTSEEEVLSLVEKAILLFREQGITGERFSDTIARLGFENVERQLLSDNLLQRKSENLSAQKHLKGGATC